MTVKLKLAERVVDEIVAKLQAGYAARVTEINAEFADGITIAAPLGPNSGGGGSDGSDFYKSGKAGIVNNPAVIVADSGSNFTREAEGPHELVAIHEVTIAVMDRDIDRETLGKKLQRHERAIIECLWDDPPAEKTMSVFHLHPTRTIPGRVFEPKDPTDPMQAFRFVLFEARLYENQ